MLSNEVIKKLNDQVAKEMYAANLYLSMSSWCFNNRFDGSGEFLLAHSSEESNHAKKIITYLNETDSKVELQAIDKPQGEFNGLLDVFEKTYDHEVKITKDINELVDFTLQHKDYATFNFLQWYISEQHEEEALFRGIVDKIKLIGDQTHGSYLADAYIKTLVK